MRSDTDKYNNTVYTIGLENINFEAIKIIHSVKHVNVDQTSHYCDRCGIRVLIFES